MRINGEPVARTGPTSSPAELAERLRRCREALEVEQSSRRYLRSFFADSKLYVLRVSRRVPTRRRDPHADTHDERCPSDVLCFDRRLRNGDTHDPALESDGD